MSLQLHSIVVEDTKCSSESPAWSEDSKQIKNDRDGIKNQMVGERDRVINEAPRPEVAECFHSECTYYIYALSNCVLR